jgi:hypothetical protein
MGLLDREIIVPGVLKIEFFNRRTAVQNAPHAYAWILMSTTLLTTPYVAPMRKG